MVRETLASLREKLTEQAAEIKYLKGLLAKSPQDNKHVTKDDFFSEVDEAIQQANENDHHVVLIYLDLDNFKVINNTLGRAVGDAVLQKVAATIQQSVRRGDVVARLEEDEFAVAIKMLRKPDYAAIVSRTILDNLGKVDINASIGVAVYPEGGKTAVELVKHAELAMYVAKAHGKNQYRFFSEQLNEENELALLIINGLRHAIRNHELFLEYQPIIDLNSLTCCAFEALIRWQHPRLGIIPPEQFLKHAEEVGAMNTIGQWVIQQALSEYKSLNLESSLFISINMSANEFLANDAENNILANIEKYNIPMQRLVVELTEKAIIRNPEATITKFKRLAELGVQIAIDDYGIGYSSLSLLKQLPISIMKIDQSFITDLDKDFHNATIVKSSIQLAHNLGLKVIAEGVETEAQLAFLKEHGCDYVQGYYFSKALNIDKLMAYLQQLNH